MAPIALAYQRGARFDVRTGRAHDQAAGRQWMEARAAHERIAGRLQTTRARAITGVDDDHGFRLRRVLAEGRERVARLALALPKHERRQHQGGMSVDGLARLTNDGAHLHAAGQASAGK